MEAVVVLRDGSSTVLDTVMPMFSDAGDDLKEQLEALDVALREAQRVGPTDPGSTA